MRMDRARAVLVASMARDRLFLAIILLLSTSNYLLHLGFYSDDWAFFATLFFSADQSPSGLYAAINFWDYLLRPFLWWLLVVEYKLFGLDPTGYHVVNALLIALGAALVYQTARSLRQSPTLAMAVALIYVFLPHHSTIRFWICTQQANVSLCLYLASVCFDLKAARSGTGQMILFKAASIACLIASSLFYELLLPAFIVTALFIYWLAGSQSWSRASAEPRKQRILLMSLVTIGVVVAVILVKTAASGRAPADPTWYLSWYASWMIELLQRAFAVGYYEQIFLLPQKIVLIIGHHARWTDLLLLALIAGGGFGYLFRSAGTQNSDLIGRRGTYAYMILGIALFVAGQTLTFVDPSVGGINNRTANAASLGLAISLVGVASLLASWAPRGWARAVFCALVMFVVSGGFLMIAAFANSWTHSYNQQIAILADIRRDIPVLAEGSSLILDGVCPNTGPAIVFDSTWDLSSALAIMYGHPYIRAEIATSAISIEDGGLRIHSGTGSYDSESLYPYDHLTVYHFGLKKVFALTDRESARVYFDTLGADLATRCPPSKSGHGVKIF